MTVYIARVASISAPEASLHSDRLLLLEREQKAGLHRLFALGRIQNAEKLRTVTRATPATVYKGKGGYWEVEV